MSGGAQYPDFPRLPGEDVFAYTDRWFAHRASTHPWEKQKPIEPPKEEPRKPYREPGEDFD